MDEQARSGSVLPTDRSAQITLWLIGGILTLAAIVRIVWVSQPDLVNAGVTCTIAGCKTPSTYAFNQLVLLLAPSALLASLICIATAIVFQVAPRQETPTSTPETNAPSAAPETKAPTAAPETDLSVFMRPSDASPAPDRPK
ncbi:MAG TPA: hypothetical protein VIJ18_13165 [Microbacteriaceae bacterium]